jgi:ferredoxin
MEINGKKLLICDCEETMALDGRALARACGAADPAQVNHQLCRAQMDNFRAAIRSGKPLMVACTQETPLFDELRQDMGSEQAISYVNIRERAGWSKDGGNALPKIAALLAEAALEMPPTPMLTLNSGGACLVYGHDEAAIDAAKQLVGHLDASVLLSKPGDVAPPRVMDVPIYSGTIAAAKGHVGAFEIVVDGYAPALPSSRRALSFGIGRDGAAATCDLILDLTGGAPLFSAGDRRDGYFRPDPKNPAAVQKALFDLVGMVGEFEKPRYVNFDASLCAHSRSRKTGCTRCLDVCPASAITSNGDSVVIDPHLCGGCGACHSVCPTGAATYVMPPPQALMTRLRTLLGAYAKAGGAAPVLLLHDPRHGEELIAALARGGDGLPAHVLPFALNESTQASFDFIASAFAYGASAVRILVSPRKQGELRGLAGQIGSAESLMSGLGFGSGRCGVILADDPDTLAAALKGPAPTAPKAGDYLPQGDKRSAIRAALVHLHEVAPAPVDAIALAPGAAFGNVKVDVPGCTLCLACVGACPTGALMDNPELPQLTFQEEACVQCGLCQVTCPEKVIRLEPRFNFTPAARQAVVVKEEQPFHCVRCGKPFGTKSAIEKVTKQLANKHAMFQSESAIKAIQMCDNCRVVAHFEEKRPMAHGTPRVMRTSEDYFREREEEARKAAGHKPGNGKDRDA